MSLPPCNPKTVTVMYSLHCLVCLTEPLSCPVHSTTVTRSLKNTAQPCVNDNVKRPLDLLQRLLHAGLGPLVTDVLLLLDPPSLHTAKQVTSQDNLIPHRGCAHVLLRPMSRSVEPGGTSSSVSCGREGFRGRNSGLDTWTGDSSRLVLTCLVSLWRTQVAGRPEPREEVECGGSCRGGSLLTVL